MVNPRPNPSERLLSLAEEYFSFLAISLPTCCLSDEFYFMPRVELAGLHRERVDCLEKDFLEELCAKVMAWKVRLENLADDDAPSLVGLLRQSMESFLLHWKTLTLWKTDPGLYLKVAFIGLDQVLDWPFEEGMDREALYRARLDAIPCLLSWGIHQLDKVPHPSRGAALDMVATCREFLAEAVEERTKGRGPNGRGMEQSEQKALEALDRFHDFLLGLRSPSGFSPGVELFEEILGHGFGWKGGIKEILEILRQEVSDKEGTLSRLARTIDPLREWQAIYNNISLPEKAFHETVSLYREEVDQLEAFFRQKNILPMPPQGSVSVEPTPSYLQPIRATASYSAPPILDDRAWRGRFYVQVLGGAELQEEWCGRFEAVHREYRYLSAHETYPGHHTLDWARLNLADPIRRRIESPLFYEGWACYAEQLVDEVGYSPDPKQHLIRIKRELWRAVRGRLDVDLHTGEITLEQGAQRLKALGYALQDARKQARRITLTPGYQLCYTLGKHRLLELRSRRVPPLSLKDFHQAVLTSGQVPFECLEPLLASEARRTGKRV